MRHDLEDAAFRSTVSDWLRGLEDSLVIDLSAILEESPGVYPTTLLELWREELGRRQLAPLPPTESVAGELHDNYLPVGHPADSDWRFTPESANELVRLALDGISASAPVAHIGTPSTFGQCVFGETEHQHVLIDRNIAVIDALAAHGIDQRHIMLGVELQAIGRMNLGAGAAIVDPPWYLEETCLFLTVAAEVCRSDATVVLCQPASGTRPGVEDERAALLSRVSALGFHFHALLSGVVRYVTPHFEAVSLRAAAGGARIPGSWRRGDVLLLKRGEGRQHPFRSVIVEMRWREVTFGPVRIKLAEHATGIELGELVQGDVLTTVSRRDPVRRRIGVWTSGNRVFTTAAPELLGQLITSCETGLKGGRFSLQHTLRHAEGLGISQDTASKLHDILSIELNEHYQRGGISNA